MSLKLNLLDYHNTISTSSKSQNLMCEAIDCYETATETIIVPAGKFGTITLYLCNECAAKKFGKQHSQRRVIN